MTAETIRRRISVAAVCVALAQGAWAGTPEHPNPDGDGTVLRVWEQVGKGGEISVTLPKGVKADKAQPVNLRGEPAGEPIAVKDGKFSFSLGAWAPASFVLD